VLPFLSLCLPWLATGCVYSLHPYKSPSQHKICIQGASPERFVVRVADRQIYPVAIDGRVRIDIPQLPRGCAVSLFGVFKLSDSGPEDVRAIHLLKDGTVVRMISLKQLRKFPVDSDGYHKIVWKGELGLSTQRSL
jgi:hypothetical protein